MSAAPPARFVAYEAALGRRIHQRGKWSAWAYEFVRFGMKQAWACLFGRLMVASVAVINRPKTQLT